MVNYALTVPKDDASVVNDVVTAIKESNGTFAGSEVGSVEKSGKITSALSGYKYNQFLTISRIIYEL